MNNFCQSNQKQFTLAKFQPGNILLINRYNKKTYNYFQLNQSLPISQQLTHPSLLRPMIYGTGLLYPKVDSTLKNQLDNRRRSYNLEYFSEDQLVNTFLSLFQCLEYLHNNKIVHGQIHPQHIVLLDGQIKIRDWLVKLEKNIYYTNKKRQNIKENDDFIALGQIIMQFATLRKSNEPFQQRDVDLAIQSIVDIYPKHIIFALIILMKKKTELFKEIIPLLQNKSQIKQNNSQINNYYTKAKLQKSKKCIKPLQKKSNIIAQPSNLTAKKTQVNVSALLQSSPNTLNTKKFNITHTGSIKKSSTKLDDSENKKVFNQQVKKRQIQKITKIIQKSNAFVNQLMSRKNNSQHTTNNNASNNGQQVLKKLNGKNTLNNMNHLGMTNTNFTNMANLSTLYSLQSSNKKVRQSFNGTTTSISMMAGSITSSPNKRMRTISKKK